MRKAGLVIAILVLLAIVLLGGGCSSYRRIVELDETAKSQWAQIDTQLQRRYDLIPNLVETVKGYAAHEKDVFESIAKARQSYFSAGDPDARARAAGDVERSLSRLLMLKEQYPQLKANEGFLKLQDQLEGTENRISTERLHYNDAVKALNAYLRSPGGMLGNLLAHVQPREYFQAAEPTRVAPTVDFSKPAAPPPAEGG